jgi:hypothetical protein
MGARVVFYGANARFVRRTAWVSGPIARSRLDGRRALPESVPVAEPAGREPEAVPAEPAHLIGMGSSFLDPRAGLVWSRDRVACAPGAARR